MDLSDPPAPPGLTIMLIRYGYEIEFYCPAPVLVLAMLDAHSDHAASIRRIDAFESEPRLDTGSYVDAYGNQVTRFVAPIGVTKISRDAVLEIDGLVQSMAPEAKAVPIDEIPSKYLVYMLGSRYCETDRLASVAWSLFGHIEPGWPRVQAICDFVNRHLTFGYQYARGTRTALEAFEERVGVCRDFAHLAVTFCRCLNIPARYANGFLGDIGVPPDPAPMDYNAWLEVYLDHRWYIFDARHNIPRIGRITVARGRDATDIPMMTSFGPHTLNSFKVWTNEIPELSSARAR